MSSILHDVCSSAELAAGAGLRVEVGGKAVALFRVGDAVHAIADACSHRAGPLSMGYQEGCNVYCPLHGWVFDVTTGRCTSHPGRDVARYEAVVREGRIWVGESPV